VDNKDMLIETCACTPQDGITSSRCKWFGFTHVNLLVWWWDNPVQWRKGEIKSQIFNNNWKEDTSNLPPGHM